MEYLEKESLSSQKKKISRKHISVDHFIVEKKQVYAGKHLLLDLWGSNFNNSISTLKKLIKNSVKTAGATLLHIHLHRFGKEQGISGVAVLAESHISVHTWPERDYIAFDIFMCGDTNPEKSAEYLIKLLKPKKKILKNIKRGVIKIDR
ncbi:adenosylmethionine decarboxylase [Alphaproteobacteria bacterium]|nr:adenosylmethionine decarboxylase [Alphaproteobacteria bacterium]